VFEGAKYVVVVVVFFFFSSLDASALSTKLGNSYGPFFLEQKPMPSILGEVKNAQTFFVF